MKTTLLVLTFLPMPLFASNSVLQAVDTLTFDTRERFGAPLPVKEGEVYRLSCPSGQRWKDWFVRTGPAGFNNPLLHIFKPRLRGAKCFCVCGGVRNPGSQGRDADQNLFQIGYGPVEYTVPADGELYFFVNDAWGAYRNNRGVVQIVVERVR